MPTKVRIQPKTIVNHDIEVPFSTLSEGEWYKLHTNHDRIGVKIGSKGFYPGGLTTGALWGYGEPSMLVIPIKKLLVKELCR